VRDDALAVRALEIEVSEDAELRGMAARRIDGETLTASPSELGG